MAKALTATERLKDLEMIVDMDESDAVAKALTATERLKVANGRQVLHIAQKWQKH